MDYKMADHNARILMITPFVRVQRGNSLTSARIRSGLTELGWQIDLLSLENPEWEDQLHYVLCNNEYSLIHGFHARHFGHVINLQPVLQKLPLILTTTGTDINFDLAGAQRTVILNAMQAVQKIVLFNDDFRNNLSSAFPEFREKMFTIPQGVSLETGVTKTRQDLGISPDEFIFLLPSGLRAIKNIELAIDSLAILHSSYPKIRLLIIGAPIDEQYSNAIINRTLTLPWITYLGEIPHNQMANILNLGDVVLNTSHSEGQPQAALEAMSLGKPCILTAVPGNINLIQSGKEGFYINNEEDLIHASRILLDSPVLRKEMGHNASQLVKTRFNLAREIDAYSRLYQEMIVNFAGHG